jgi:two-component system, OmpR family, osmolarity sensor histidine kinase EnvZ
MQSLSLFWRSFWLLAALQILIATAAVGLVHFFDRSPPEKSLAWEISSLVNLTRSALVSSSSDRRAALLLSLEREEQVRIVPIEPDDQRITFAQAKDVRATQINALQARLSELAAKPVEVYFKVNGQPGLWVNFDIDEDAYWLQFSLERLDRQAGPTFAVLLAITGVLSLIGAALLSNAINAPLRRLSQSIERLRLGHDQPQTSKSNDGAAEVLAIEQQFQDMANALTQAQQDRELTLAGVSHDLRTPLTRLRLQLELAQISPGDQLSMNQDIDQINHIVDQFVLFGRLANDAPPQDQQLFEAGDFAGLQQATEQLWRTSLQSGRLKLHWLIEAGPWRGSGQGLQRMMNNLIENALRYGYTQGPDLAPCSEVWIRLQQQGQALALQVHDAGPGVSDQDLSRVLRPFVRGEQARTQASDEHGPAGSGLGLAIVQRLAKQANGTVQLNRSPHGGLAVTVRLLST